jgi:hypothetical protein
MSLEIVMPALVAGIHGFLVESLKTWMAGTSPATTPHVRQLKTQALCEIWTHSERWIVSTR